ncbi:hypothetical protein B296_00026646 [Ensete ventricosum]|uniref:Uncharacterized protein n=1 Tax=Ensete ventricosum TaxID=4639 RepID=A0A426XED5_ENSVE|nr:hypothetical protein B296_00026646 [Ensete ventricosum]
MPRKLLRYQVLEPLRILSLGVITIGHRPPWNSIGVPFSKCCSKAAGNTLLSMIKKWIIIKLFIGLLTLIPNRTPTPRLLLINS